MAEVEVGREEAGVVEVELPVEGGAWAKKNDTGTVVTEVVAES